MTLCPAAFGRLEHGLLILMLAFWVGTPQAGQAQRADEVALAKSYLSQLQDRSFRNNREYCAYMFRRPDGSLGTSKAYRGTEAKCRIRNFRFEGTGVGSMHTHGGYVAGYDNEVPSLGDLQLEVDTGTDGFVATPAGRFWHIDGRRGRVRLICGPGCLPSTDTADDQVSVFGKIRSRYDARSLAERTKNLSLEDYFCKVHGC